MHQCSPPEQVLDAEEVTVGTVREDRPRGQVALPRGGSWTCPDCGCQWMSWPEDRRPRRWSW